VVHHLGGKNEAGAGADSGGDMYGFHHLGFVGAFAEAVACVGVNAVGALNGVRYRQSDQGFFAFGESAFFENFAVPGKKFVGHGLLPVADVAEFFQVGGVKVFFFGHDKLLWVNFGMIAC